MSRGKRYRATVAYDGTEFFGFQFQRELPTVQGEIEHAIARVSGQAVRISGAGRTDAGVHARGQVITFNLTWRHDTRELERALNAVVRPAISFRDLSECAPRFHARYSATARVYVYRFYRSTVRDPLLERFAWRVHPDLDVKAMAAAASGLVGVHDFAGFGQPTSGTATMRRIVDTRFETDVTDAELLSFVIEGSGFLRGMVRRIVGSLVQVGLGNWPVARIGELLLQRDINESAPPAPPQGLILWQVRYDDHVTADGAKPASSDDVSESSPSVGLRSSES